MDAAASPGRALAQLEAIYGATNAGIILDNLDTQTLSPQSKLENRLNLEQTLGLKSDYAHSEHSREGEETSQGPPYSLVSHLPNG